MLQGNVQFPRSISSNPVARMLSRSLDQFDHHSQTMIAVCSFYIIMIVSISVLFQSHYNNNNKETVDGIIDDCLDFQRFNDSIIQRQRISKSPANYKLSKIIHTFIILNLPYIFILFSLFQLSYQIL